MSATDERDQVNRIAGFNLDSALRIARKISDPWFGCQALACVASHTLEHQEFLKRVAESLKSGWSIKDPNRAVTVIAWPVAALARRQFSNPDERSQISRELVSIIAQLTKAIAMEPNPASRADALLIHIHALSPSCSEFRAEVMGLLIKECKNPMNRKRQPQLEEAALVIALDAPDLALGLTASLDESRKHRTIESIKNHSKTLGPRPFFAR